MNKALLSGKPGGFTIVELLIVVVVIAILAAITIVSYNGISNRAEVASLKTDLSTTAKKLNIEKIDNGSFPTSSPDYIISGLSYTGGGATFCVSGEANNKTFRIDARGIIEEDECVASMQAFTLAKCSALATYTGANSDAIIELVDSRGGIERTYEVAKLADGKCWMLTNLKLGSTTGTVTLTPADSDVASNYTLPQVAISLQSSVVGPVPGDTGSGATNYGYLYNWEVVTAGETETSHPANAGNAPYSICPANWRLPTGGNSGEFAWLNAKMNNPNASSPSFQGGTGYYQNWNYTGPFKGVFAGRNYNFGNVGTYGYVWSSSAYSGNVSLAAEMYFYTTGVNPIGGYGDRSFEMAVRCILG